MEQTLIKDLVDIIRKEEDLLKQFLELLETQKTMLVKNDVQDFEMSVARQERMIAEIKDLENSRILMVNKIAEGMDVKESEITITRLVEMSLGQVSSELSTAKKSMTNLVTRIKRANQVNQYLIKRSVNMAQKSIDILIDESLRDVIYEQDGKIKGQDRRSLMINKTL